MRTTEWADYNLWKIDYMYVRVWYADKLVLCYGSNAFKTRPIAHIHIRTHFYSPLLEDDTREYSIVNIVMCVCVCCAYMNFLE